MKQFRGLCSVIFFLVLLVPGYALGAPSFTIDPSPRSVVAGETFDVTVYLSDPDPSYYLSDYTYCFSYDETLLELVQLVPNHDRLCIRTTLRSH